MDYSEAKQKGFELWKAGESLTSIERKGIVSRVTLAKYIKSMGLAINNPAKKYHYNERYFETIDNEYKAYWLGFIFADGCINELAKSMNLEISLQSRDREHLVKFEKSLEFDTSVVRDTQVKLNGKSYPTSRMNVCSKYLCESLIKLGCTSRKSFTKRLPKIDSNLYRHFIRGYFDGNGHISYPRCRITLTSNSDFLESLNAIFKSVGITPTSILSKQGTEIKSIEYSGYKAKKILEYMYSGSNVHLEHKKNLSIAHLIQPLQKSKDSNEQNRRRLIRKKC